MKRMIWLAAGIVLALACKKEDPAPTNPPAPAQIEGQWQGTNIQVILNGFGQVASPDISYLGFDFQADGTVKLDSLGVALPDGQWWEPSANTIGIDGYLPLNFSSPLFPPITGFVLDSMELQIATLTATQFQLRKDSNFAFMGSSVPGYVLVNLTK